MTFKKQGSEGVFVLDYITQITNFNLITNHILLCVQSLLSIDNDVPKTDSVPEENGESSGNLMKIENSAGYAQPATRIQYTFPSDATPKEKVILLNPSSKRSLKTF